MHSSRRKMIRGERSSRALKRHSELDAGIFVAFVSFLVVIFFVLFFERHLELDSRGRRPRGIFGIVLARDGSRIVSKIVGR